MDILKKPSPTWYKENFTLAMKDATWVENTLNEVDFIIDIMELSGSERILDLACGFGRHSIELARRGFSVVGVDIAPDLIKEANRIASAEKLGTEFICAELRDLSFNNEFDVVLNMGEGAIGYLEDDNENLKIFDLIASSLKPGGKHFMEILNAEHAEAFFPKKSWYIGEKVLAIEEYLWDEDDRRMLFSGWGFRFGEIAKKPDADDITPSSSIRAYSISEVEEMLTSKQMTIMKTYGNSFGQFSKDQQVSNREIQLLVYSQKNK
ncbi:MAG: class I SAM-dependent methyltransferase [Desulfobacteraceae bacterium]|jgi:SAM-dependent methyltransferase